MPARLLIRFDFVAAIDGTPFRFMVHRNPKPGEAPYRVTRVSDDGLEVISHIDISAEDALAVVTQGPSLHLLNRKGVSVQAPLAKYRYASILSQSEPRFK